MALSLTNSIYGINTIAQAKTSEVDKSAKRIADGKKLPGDDIVSFAMGNGIDDNLKYYQGLIKSVGNGVVLLQMAQNGLERINTILTHQKSLLNTAAGKNQANSAMLDSVFQKNVKEIDNIIKQTKFSDLKLLDGTFGVDRTRMIKYPYKVNSVSIASKQAPVGPLVFLRDDVAFQPFESSAAMVTLNQVKDGDYIIVEGDQFIFRDNPDSSITNEVKLHSSDEENARRLVTAILNSKNIELKRYAATNIGAGILSIQSQIRSGKAANVSTISASISVDNITPKSDPNVLDLDKLVDNSLFYGRVSPNFVLNATPVYDLDARNLAKIHGIDLNSYVGDIGDSAAQYNCTIGNKDYAGVIFLRGNGGVVQAMNSAPAGLEKLFLVMREVNNTDSSFTVNFDPTYTGILDNQASAEQIRDELNSLFSRMVFKQNRYMAVNKIPDSKSLKLFDPETTTATITSTNFDSLEIENFAIRDISSNLVEFRLTINGMEYSDSTVTKNLREGDRISMEFDSSNFLSLTVGKGGLNLNNTRHFNDVVHDIMTFFTNQEVYHQVQVTKTSGEGITTKIENFSTSELFQDENGKYKELSIFDKLGRRRASVILNNATAKVMNQMARIQNAIDSIRSEMVRIESSLNISGSSYRSFTSIDLVKSTNEFSQNIKDIHTLIAVISANKILDFGVQQIIFGLSSVGNEASQLQGNQSQGNQSQGNQPKNSGSERESNTISISA